MEDTSSSGATGSSGPTDGGPTDPLPDLPGAEGSCGDGVLDPGEACDDGQSGCDACTDACTLPVDVALEWSVALAPMVRVRDLAMTQGGRFYVLGEDAGEAALLYTIEASGVTHTVDFADIGLARALVFGVNAAATDDAEVAILGEDAVGTRMVARFGQGGLLGELLPVDDSIAGADIAVTSAGIAILDHQQFWSVSPAGVLGGPFASFDADGLDALADRLVFFANAGIVMTDPDGGATVEIPCPATMLTTSGTHAVWGTVTYEGEASMGSCELATGEVDSAVVTTGESGLEALPTANVRGGGANGHPIGEWSVCPIGQGSAMGCMKPRERGFGGPGDPRALELDACDQGGTAVVAPDGRIYMVRLDRETGAPSLVWRATLPDQPPWN